MLTATTVAEKRPSLSALRLAPALLLALATTAVAAPPPAAAQTVTLTVNVPMRARTATGLVVAPGGVLTVTVGPIPAACVALGPGNFSENVGVIVPASGPNTLLGVLGFGTTTALPVTASGDVGLQFTGTIAGDGRDACIASTTPVELDYSPTSDTTAPQASPTQSPLANQAGWNASDVTVTWNWTDNSGGSGVDPNHCTTTSTSTGDGRNLTLSATCQDLAGNTGSDRYLVSVDRTPPTIGAAATTPPNSNGWYAANVTVHFTCSDALSGLASCPPDQVLSAEGSVVASTVGTATDVAGNSSTSNVVTVAIDKTAPVVSYTGNAGSYTVDQQVQITCTPSDATSGVASNTCRTISGPAYSFGLGTHTYSAIATDRAGNTGSGSTSFTVGVSPTSLQTLVNRFCTNPSVAASLDQDLATLAHAPNANARAGVLQGFTHLVQAQTGKSLTSAQASTLISLANAL